MTDFKGYIDSPSIKLGDLGAEMGDINFAIKNYSKALDKLRKYEEECLELIELDENLSKKIYELSDGKDSSKNIFVYESWVLSKTSYVKGQQCEKQLYLEKHKKDQKTPFRPDQIKILSAGHDFEGNFREKEFPNGINIVDKVGDFGYLNSYTKHLLSEKSKQILYEATIIEDEVLIMCDVLIKDEEGRIDVYEVKLSKEINESIENDLALQYYICKKRFGSQLNSFNLVLREDDEGEKWNIENMTEALDVKIPDVQEKIENFKRVLENDEPPIKMGDHCNKPYECQFMDYCKLNLT